MRAESLDELKMAFDVWRSKKRHAREAVPDGLLERARRTIAVHGLGPVVRVTGIERSRLMGRRNDLHNRRRADVAAIPSFSRVALVAPTAMNRPFAEIEIPTGVKLRFFTETHETVGFLSSLCGMGGASR